MTVDADIAVDVFDEEDGTLDTEHEKSYGPPKRAAVVRRI